jgi:FtsP/CotA-like multicopper oxidase with cupredoxin domain
MRRRDLFRLSMAGGASLLLPAGCRRRDLRSNAGRTGMASAQDTAIFRSPPTTPFLMTLPIPPPPRPVAPFASDCTQFTGEGTTFFEIVEEERFVQVSPNLPPTVFWGYRDATVDSWPFAVGPTFHGRMTTSLGNGFVVRQYNQLPSDHRGFGVPYTTVHFHGGHNPSRSDGFPTLDFGPGTSFDYCYPLIVPGTIVPPLAPGDVPSTMWYHDHLLDFTGQNVYIGLVGFFLVFDDLDTGDETTGLGLPSGPFDIPIVIQDKSFAPDGSLVFDVFNRDGFLGDKFLMNGVIQPFLRVKRRKYRFRFLDGSNARFYQVFLATADGRTYPFDQIATEGGLLAAPIRGVESFYVAPATRVEVVIDVSAFEEGEEVFLENRLQQDDGRRPGGLVPRGPQLLKFIVEERVPDPSQVLDVLRPFAAVTPQEIAAARRRRFVFNRTEGDFAINNILAGNLAAPVAVPTLGAPEIWHLENKSGGWAHPIHVHLDFMRVLTRNGELPPLDERDGMARRDTVVLGPNDEVEVFLRFHDFTGPFVFHCHNLEHEDMAMMGRFDTVSAT